MVNTEDIKVFDKTAMWYIIVLISCILAITLLCAFFISRFGYVNCNSNVCLIGKVALVTGGSRGLGHEIVLSLASRGCKVIVAGKTISEELRMKIIDATNNPNIVLEYVDFASFKSVRQFADKLNATEEKLDILVNNSGIGKSLDEDITEDGFNMTMQVNHYSPFLLTHLLVGLLKKSDNGRIIFTSSFLSFLHILTHKTVTESRIKDVPSALRFFDYPNSKFCNIVTADIFAEKLKKWNITSNCYNPLVAKTSIFQQTSKNVNYDSALEIVLNFLLQMMEFIYGISPKLTSQGAVLLAVSKEYKNVTGTFLGRVFPNLKPRGSNDKKLCNAIWKASEKVVQLRDKEKL